MPINNAEQRKKYMTSYYRKHRAEKQAKARARYEEKKDEINAKAREARRKKKEEQIKIDRANGIWDF